MERRATSACCVEREAQANAASSRNHRIQLSAVKDQRQVHHHHHHHHHRRQALQLQAPRTTRSHHAAPTRSMCRFRASQAPHAAQNAPAAHAQQMFQKAPQPSRVAFFRTRPQVTNIVRLLAFSEAAHLAPSARTAVSLDSACTQTPRTSQ